VDRLYRAAWSMSGSRHDAGRLLQETLARAQQGPRKLRSANDLPYFLSVLRDSVVSRRHATSRRAQTTNELKTTGPFADPSVAPPGARTDAGDVYRTIAALPADFRDAVAAVDVMGLSYREAASALGVREATMTTSLYRGRLQIARVLAEPPAPR
jgi:RNA polymerase sigma-70 factor (ECF subfamily)